MDIMLDNSGDLFITDRGDIVLANSVAQKIKIRLRWLAAEWRWDEEEGLPYKEELLVKNPDTDFFESLIRAKIFEVDEVTEVQDVAIQYDAKTREGVIWYVALTDFETIREEVKILCQITE